MALFAGPRRARAGGVLLPPVLLQAGGQPRRLHHSRGQSSMTLATSSTCHVDAHFLSIILGWRIPFPGFRNPPESTRIRPSTKSVRFRMRLAAVTAYNSVSDLVSKVWYRIPFDQSDPSITKMPPTDPRTSDRVAILESIDPRSRGDKKD